MGVFDIRGVRGLLIRGRGLNKPRCCHAATTRDRSILNVAVMSDGSSSKTGTCWDSFSGSQVYAPRDVGSTMSTDGVMRVVSEDFWNL